MFKGQRLHLCDQDFAVYRRCRAHGNLGILKFSRSNWFYLKKKYSKIYRFPLQRLRMNSDIMGDSVVSHPRSLGVE